MESNGPFGGERPIDIYSLSRMQREKPAFEAIPN
jgi:hypothetical protein